MLSYVVKSRIFSSFSRKYWKISQNSRFWAKTRPMSHLFWCLFLFKNFFLRNINFMKFTLERTDFWKICQNPEIPLWYIYSDTNERTVAVVLLCCVWVSKVRIVLLCIVQLLCFIVHTGTLFKSDKIGFCWSLRHL